MTGDSGPRLLDLASMSVARQLTVVGHALYSMIEPSELTNLNFSKRPDELAPNFAKLKAFFGKCQIWAVNQVRAPTMLLLLLLLLLFGALAVPRFCLALRADKTPALITYLLLWDRSSAQVLRETDVAARGEVLKRLVQVADMCLEPLHNFDGLMAMVGALNSSDIHRLKKSWARLDRKTAKQWERIQDLTKSGGRKLAPIIKKAPPPSVPYLGLHLSVRACCEAHGARTEQRTRTRTRT